MNAITLYRIYSKLYQLKVPMLPKFLSRVNFLIFNSYIPPSTIIGKGTKLSYGGIGVVIHMHSIIGNNCIIGQGITIGRKRVDTEAPIIGDDVYLSAGCRILGDIKIGNNVIVGANSVVTSDVESDSIVAGIPARKIKKLDMSIYDYLEG